MSVISFHFTQSKTKNYSKLAIKLSNYLLGSNSVRLYSYFSAIYKTSTVPVVAFSPIGAPNGVFLCYEIRDLNLTKYV